MDTKSPRLSTDTGPVAGGAGLVDPGIMADARSPHIPCRAGLIDSGIPAETRSAHVPCRARLIDSGIPADTRTTHIPAAPG